MDFAVYFESQPDGWSVRRDDLLARLASDWPDAKLLPPEYQNVTEMGETGWEYVEGEQHAEVWYAASGVGLTLECDDEDLVLRFVAWFRGLHSPSISELESSRRSYMSLSMSASTLAGPASVSEGSKT